jgi:hypothetical protein
MGQIPIDRGKGDVGALERAIADLRAGACIGVFPRGHPQPRARAARPQRLRPPRPGGPEAQVVSCRVVGTHRPRALPEAPRHQRPLLPPRGGGLQEGEELTDFGERLLEEIRREAPDLAGGAQGTAGGGLDELDLGPAAVDLEALQVDDALRSASIVSTARKTTRSSSAEHSAPRSRGAPCSRT